MNKSVIIATACVVAAAGVWGMGFMSGASFEQDRAIRAAAKQSARQARADAQAVENARSFTAEIDKGLISDAHKTDAAVSGAKARLHALKPSVAVPAPQCGPSAYIISVQGATPDDIYRAYALGRNSMFATPDSGSATGHDSTDVSGVMLAATAQPE